MPGPECWKEVAAGGPRPRERSAMTRRPRRNPRGLTMPPGRRIPRTPAPKPDLPPSAGAPVPLPGALSRAGADLAALVGAVRACQACRRAADRRAFGSGHPRATVFFLKDRPSPEDLKAETAFASEAEALQRALERLGIPVWWAYGSTAVRCGTGSPAPEEVRACSVHLLTELEAVRPRVVVAFGPAALEALRALDGRCGIRVPEEVPRGKPVPLRPGLELLLTEPLPQGVREPEAKRRLWADLRILPSLVGT